MTLSSGTRFGPYEILALSSVDGGKQRGRPKGDRWRWIALGAAAVLAAAVAASLAGAVHWGRPAQPSFQQVSFRQGRQTLSIPRHGSAAFNASMAKRP